MRLSEFLERFENPRKAGGGYSVRCPGHEDKHASLSVTEKDGKILLRCFAGCELPSILGALGIEARELFAEELKRGLTIVDLAADKGLSAEFLRKCGLRESGNAVEIPYLDLSGAEVATRIRLDVKAGKGSRWKAGSVVAPYGLARMRDFREGAYLVLVEGESDCWTLWHHGYAAIGLPGASMAGKLDAAHLEGISTLYAVREPDQGGETMIAQVRERLRAIGWSGEFLPVVLPLKDPNALHQSDPGGFKARFEAALVAAEPAGLGVERALIATVASGGMANVAGRVLPGDFASLPLGRVYEAAERVFQGSGRLDAVTLTEYLRTTGKHREVVLLAKALESRHEPAQVEAYLAMLLGESQRRRIAAAASTILRDSETLEPGELSERSQRIMFDATARLIMPGPVHVKAFVRPVWERVIQRIEGGGGVTAGLSSGYAAIDQTSGGLHAGNMYVLAARPGMGKTSLALGTVLNVAARGIPVLIFSLEMTAEELVERMIAIASGIAHGKLTSGTGVDRLLFGQWSKKLAEMPIHIQDSGSISITALRSQAMRLASTHGCGLLVIDYIQLVKASGTKRNQTDESEVAEVSKATKALAKDLRVPAMVLAQLNRAVEKRGDKPQLSDLRSSGQLEQDADVVAFIHRERDEDGTLQSDSTLCVRKNRHGPPSEYGMTFDGPCMAFRNKSFREEHRS